MFEAIILGIIQGVAEWLPVSSEGLIIIIKTNFFETSGLEETVRLALFLHLGTFFAALIYFRREVWKVIQTVINYRRAPETDRKIFWFLFFSTLISGVFGFFILQLFIRAEESFEEGSRAINLTIGILLLVTAYLQLKKKNSQATRQYQDLKKGDWITLGLMQSFASLPGLSRSGLTVAGLLLRKIKEEQALTLSFLMSLPIVLGGNILLNSSVSSVSANQMVALAASFIFGLLTIHWFLKLAKKINFGIFVLIFGILMIAASII